MKNKNHNQGLSNQEIVKLMKDLKISYRNLRTTHKRGISQVYYAVHSSDYPGLRKRIINSLLKRAHSIEVDNGIPKGHNVRKDVTVTVLQDDNQHGKSSI